MIFRSAPIVLLFGLFTCFLPGQSPADMMAYEASEAYPFGRPHPDLPAAIRDFEPMIGVCDCRSMQRRPDGTWQDTLDMTWKFKYIMNGTAVQDEVWREDGMYAGSIRMYHPDSAKWAVTYFSYPFVSISPGTWLGEREDDKIVLKMPQKAPGTGMEGVSRLTFYDWSEAGFHWIGEWVSKDGSVVYPFWKIECRRREE